MAMLARRLDGARPLCTMRSTCSTHAQRTHSPEAMSSASWADAARSYGEALRIGSWKLSKSTGRAAWILGTTLLVLAVPLIVEMDREQQVVELENQQLGALTGGGSLSNK